jgi:hypothetical protein
MAIVEICNQFYLLSGFLRNKTETKQILTKGRLIDPKVFNRGVYL